MLKKYLLCNLIGFMISILSSCRAETKDEALHQCILRLNYEKTFPYTASNNYEELRYSVPLSGECRELLYSSVGSMSFKLQAEGEKNEGALTMIDFGGERVLSYSISGAAARKLDEGTLVVEGDYLNTSSAKTTSKIWFFPWSQLPEKVYVYFAMPSPVQAFDFPKSVEVTLKSLDY